VSTEECKEKDAATGKCKDETKPEQLPNKKPAKSG
jgi:hypothetical protein